MQVRPEPRSLCPTFVGADRGMLDKDEPDALGKYAQGRNAREGHRRALETVLVIRTPYTVRARKRVDAWRRC